MPDQTNDVKIILAVQGVETIAKLRKAVKEAKADMADFATGNLPALDYLGWKIANTQDRIDSLTKLAHSSNARMKESYFTLGEQIRSRTIPAMTSMAQVIQDAPYGLRGVGNNIEQLTMQITQLAASGMSASMIFKDFLKAITGPIGILFAVSIITSLATAFGDKLLPNVEKATSKLGEMMDKVAELEFTLEKISTGTYFDYLATKAEEVAKIKPESGSVLAWLWNVAKGAWYDTGIPLAASGYEKLGQILREKITGVKYAGIFSADALDALDKQDLEKEKTLSKQDVLLSTQLKKNETAFKIQNDSAKLTIAQLTTLAAQALELSKSAKFEKERNELLLARVGYLDQIDAAEEKTNKKKKEKKEKEEGYGSNSTLRDSVFGKKKSPLDLTNDGLSPFDPSTDSHMIGVLYAGAEQRAQDAKAGEMLEKYLKDLKEKKKAEKQAHKDAITEWKEENQGAMAVIDSIKAGWQTMISTQVMVTRNAASILDGIWISMENTFISSIGRMTEAWLESGLIGMISSLFNPFAGIEGAGGLAAFISSTPAPRISGTKPNTANSTLVMNERRSSDNTKDLIKAFKSIDLRFAMSTRKVSIELQGVNRKRESITY